MEQHFDSNDEMEIDLLGLFFRLLEKAHYIVIAALIGALVAGIYTFGFITPMYSATSKLYVLNSGDSVVNLSELQLGNYLAADYQEVFKTWELHEMVISNLNLNYSYGQMQSMISVSNPKDTRILYITATTADPDEAMMIANEYAAAAKDYIARTMATDEPNMFSVAYSNPSPISPSKTRNVMLGFLGGAFIAIAILTIMFITDDKVKSADDIMKYTNLPTLASIPSVKEDEQDKHPQSKRKGNKKK